MPRKLSLREDPNHLKKQKSLFPDDSGLIKKSPETLASEYIAKLQMNHFVMKNKVYLSNYIDNNIGIALGHIKNAYKKYVCEKKWPEKKFNEVIKDIIKRNKIISEKEIIETGKQFDEGSIVSDFQNEKTEEEYLKILLKQWGDE